MRTLLHTRAVSVAVLCCMMSWSAVGQTPEPAPQATPEPTAQPPAQPPPAQPADGDWARRIGRLSTAIDGVATRERTARLATGGVSLAAGGLMILGGVLIHDECSSGDGGLGCRTGAWVLGIFGTVAVAGGIVALAVKGENEAVAERFAMVQATQQSQQLVAEQGEGILKGMADNARRNRYITAGVLVGAGVLGLLSAFGATVEEDSDVTTGQAAGAGLIPLVLFGGWGVVEFFWPSAVERAWDDYEADFPSQTASWWDNTYATPMFSIRPDGNTYTGVGFGFVF